MLHEEIRKASDLTEKRARAGKLTVQDLLGALAVMRSIADQVEALENTFIPPLFKVHLPNGTAEVVQLPRRPVKADTRTTPAPFGGDAA